MGTILASAIKTKILANLPDGMQGKFIDADFLSWINEGQKQIVIAKHDANHVKSAVQLIAGTAQALATDEIALYRLTRNMGTDGATPGNHIFMVNFDEFGKRNPSWHTDTESATVQVAMYDPEDPLRFWVYPKQPSASMGYVEKIVSKIPTAVSAIGNAISLNDEYEAPLYRYGLYMATIEDRPELSEVHLKHFYELLGRHDMSEKVAFKKIKEA